MDRDVLAQLYERYYQPALFYLLALCRDRHLAEDLVQEAFVRAYLSLPEDVPSFPYWLMRVCRNLLCDHRRKRRRHADGELRTVNGPDAKLAFWAAETVTVAVAGTAVVWRRRRVRSCSSS